MEKPVGTSARAPGSMRRSFGRGEVRTGITLVGELRQYLIHRV